MTAMKICTLHIHLIISESQSYIFKTKSAMLQYIAKRHRIGIYKVKVLQFLPLNKQLSEFNFCSSERRNSLFHH